LTLGIPEGRPSLPPTHRLSALGGLDLRGPDGLEVKRALRQPKRMALLAYLRHRRDFVTRDHLLAVFWPEADLARAQSALRQSVGFLRRCLHRTVLEGRGRGEIGVAQGAVPFDVTDFEDRVRAREWERAIALYRGDFLNGFFVDASNEFNDWVEALRSELRDKAGGAAWALAVECEQAGRFDRAAYWAKRSLSLTPYGEADVRRVARLLDRVGDRLGALRAFKGLRDRLARDFDAEPSPETRALFEQVISRTVPHAEMDGGRRRERPEGRSVRRGATAPGGKPGSQAANHERRATPDRRSDQSDRRRTPERRSPLE